MSWGSGIPRDAPSAVREADVAEVIRLALAGVHVNIAGPRGSDLVALLDEVGSRLEGRGLPVVRLGAAAELGTAPFAALRLAYPELVADARDPASVVDRFCAFLAEHAPVSVLVDTVDHLDPFTAHALSEGVRRAGAHLITTASTTSARIPDSITAEPHSQIVLQNFSHFELEIYLTSLTARPLELELVTRLYVETRGTPVFARTLFLSGIREGQIAAGPDGRWRLATDELWTPETTFAIAASLAAIGEPLLECLRAVHLDRAPSVASLLTRFAPSTVASLEREGLIGVLRMPDSEPLVTVTPPVVARHLDEQLGGVLRAVRAAPESFEADLDDDVVLSLEVTRATSERAAAARAAFEASPTARHALEFIHALWARGAPYEEAERVFEAPRSATTPEEELDLIVLRARWLAFGAQRMSDALRLLDTAAHLPGDLPRLAAAHRLLLDALATGVTGEVLADLGELSRLPPDTARARLARLTALSVHLLAGHAHTVVDLANELPDEAQLRPLRTYLRGFGLLATDDPAHAVALASEALERGKADLDPDLVFASSYVLVAAHLLLGGWAKAQRLAKAVRAIGRPSLYTMHLYRNALGLQALVFAEEGDTDIPGGLIRSLQEDGSGRYAWGQQGMTHVVRFLATRDYEEVARVLPSTAEGTRDFGNEHFSSYLWAFALGLEPRLVDQAPQLSESADLDAFARLREFVRLVVHGSADEVAAAARAYPPSTFAYHASLALLRTAQRVATTDPPRADACLELAEEMWARLSIPRPEKVLQGRAPVLGLSARELQVAMLTSRLTNREIADRLGLSERTVDHHVSSALRKSGARDRRELGTLVTRVRGEW